MAKKVILLVNLGSPDSTSVRDVRRYLNEFLMDGKVIDLPPIPRFLLVRGIISPFRSFSSAKKYKTIWTDRGSPLVYMTDDLCHLVAKETNLPTYFAMRYGTPTADSVLNKIESEHKDLEEITVVPLYPHYAMSSLETALKDVHDTYSNKPRNYDIKYVPAYYDNEKYITCLANSIKPYLQEDDDAILFSYHGIPERHIYKTDVTKSHCSIDNKCCAKPSEAHTFCYRHQVKKTTELTRKELNLSPEKVMLTFQSRLGRDPWLQPYTAKTLEELPKKGIKKLVVCCPAFVTDCLETLEEIHEEGQEIFMEAGGERYITVPCLNLNQEWVHTISSLLNTATSLHEFSLR